MLTIRVVSFKGQPVGNQVARFGEAGGTVGRGKTSTLVLQDPELFISRTHATISFQAGGFIITDNGTKNPVVLNGQPLGSGRQARLGDGDTIQIGGYLLEASLSVAFLAPSPTAGGDHPWIGQPKDDPLAFFESPRGKGPDPFADLSPRPPAVLSTPAPPQRAAADPLAGLHGREPSIDELLDLKQPGGPVAGSPDAAWPSGLQPSPPAVVDPIDMIIGIVRPPAKPTVPDHAPEVGAAFAPPVPRPDPAFQSPAPFTPPLTPSPSAAPAAGVGNAAMAPPPYQAPPAGAVPAPFQGPAAPPAPYQAPLAGAPPVPFPSPPEGVSPGLYQTVPAGGSLGAEQAPSAAASPHLRSGAEADAAEAALFRALLNGAGISGSPLLSSLTPETMETVGHLLREAVQGTLDLLRARGLMKSEMRADVTRIMPIENNPLKFSPTVEAALAHLLVPQVQGFLPPVRAMQEAYDDLRAHQFAFLAGVRAELEDVLARFAPAELERRLSDPSMLDNLLPMNRRAKQWDLFVERYEDVVAEAREDFNAPFGKAFLRAYEAQVKKFRSGGSSTVS